MPREIRGIHYEAKFHLYLNEELNKDRLKLLDYFIKKHRNDLRDEAKIRFHDKDEEHVVEISGSNLAGVFYLKRGWSDFLKKNKIEGNHLLFFKYQGNSRFTVKAYRDDRELIKYIDDFTVRICPSHVTRDVLEVPSTHAAEYLGFKEGTQVRLINGEGRVTVVDCKERFNKDSRRVEFKEGWLDFVNSNNISVGDTCTFHLLESREQGISYMVYIRGVK